MNWNNIGRHRDKVAWMTVKKTKAELRPNRLMHRAYDKIVEMEKAYAEAKGVTAKKFIKNMKEKAVEVEAAVTAAEKVAMGHACNEHWHWEEFAIDRYTSVRTEATLHYIEMNT